MSKQLPRETFAAISILMLREVMLDSTELQILGVTESHAARDRREFTGWHRQSLSDQRHDYGM